MVYFALLIFAALPSFIWMTYYLQKDKNPEPKHLIIYVFLAGMVSAIIGYFLQRGALDSLIPFLENKGLSSALLFFISGFIVVAFSEELLKYLAVFCTVRHNSEMDEPVDIIVYLIVAALGFAALENLLYLYTENPVISDMALQSAIRFVGATFLHALASGILGIFLLYSWRKGRQALLFFGLGAVTLLHGIYNMIVSLLDTTLGEIYFIFSVVLLILFLFAMAATLSWGIERAKEMKSICLLK